MEMADRLSAVRFNALRNAIYHTSRRRFLDLANRLLSLIVVASGALAVAQFAEQLHIAPTVYAFVAAMAGLLQLVFDFGGAARTHEFLQRRFYELSAEITEKKEPTDDDLARWEATLNHLYAEEPPPMRAVDAIAYNAAIDSVDPKKEGRIRLRWWQVAFAQVWSFSDTAFS
jgi:hypothetical protein